jgi:tartrate dehydratase alpha subunit/fumarate hydratase class I-like protein
MPAVAEFVDAAIAAARELAAAAARSGLPQKLSEVELTAKIVRSNRFESGISFTGIGPAGLGGGASRTSDEANTVRLVFAAR